jgi:tRNA dimethylallyltransferase
VSERPRALALTGPTTSGKTDLSLAVARRLEGEIISMDSRQVYRGMDVGTDKVLTEARAGIPHFGLDLVEPEEHYSAGRFARDARAWIAEIEERGHLPLLVGGTGFFLRAVLEPIFREPVLDRARRDRLRNVLDRLGRSTLERWVGWLDPRRAAVAAQGGPQRLSRTLEVALLSGRPLSWWHEAAPPDGPAVPCLVVVLELPRDELDRRIDARVDRMVEGGLLDEVRGLLARGFRPDAPGMTGTGYREIAAHLGGEMTLDEALDEMRQQTRRYARRQLTWFRNQLPPDALRLDGRLPLDEKADQVERVWRQRRGEGET